MSSDHDQKSAVGTCCSQEPDNTHSTSSDDNNTGNSCCSPADSKAADGVTCESSSTAKANAGGCCDPEPVKANSGGGCCGPQPAAKATASSCCPSDEGASGWRSVDWLLWGSLAGVVVAYVSHLASPASAPGWVMTFGHSVFDLINTMWWGIVLAALFVGVIGRIPQQMIISVLGQGGTIKGLWRATLAGVLLDLCSHGILMVGMQLYQRGASMGQVIAFLLASPWNSLSLTIILVALIGLPYTLLFIALSMVIGLVTGYMFDRLVAKGTLPANPNKMDLPADYHFWREVSKSWKTIQWSPQFIGDLVWEGIKGSRMVLRWLFFGVLLATAIRSFVSLDDFQTWFGPSAIGLLATLVAATIIEVCSEGSTPIAADLVTRAGAPGNGFAFLMTGVATDYTEVMVIKDTTKSWKIALFLPLLTVPQVFVIGLILNGVLV